MTALRLRLGEQLRERGGEVRDGHVAPLAAGTLLELDEALGRALADHDLRRDSPSRSASLNLMPGLMSRSS